MTSPTSRSGSSTNQYLAAMSKLSSEATKEDQLSIASFFGATRVVRPLLKRGASSDKKDSEGNTALHMAAVTDKLECVKLLVKNKADVGTSNNKGQNALHVAAQYGSVSVLSYLASKKPRLLNSEDKEGCTPYSVAIKEEKFEVAVWILNNKSRLTY